MKNTTFLFLLLFLFSFLVVIGQEKVGINITMPNAHLDIRGTDNNISGGELNLGTPDNNHFIRLFGGRNLDRNPFLLFSALDTFRISSSFADFSKFTDHFKVTPDGYVGVGSSTPSQKLDVDGKLKIGNDNIIPEQGTMRYDAIAKRFEGFDGTDWILLSNNNPYLIYNNIQGTFNDRNTINDLGVSIVIPEDGTYILSITAYTKSYHVATYLNTDSGITYDYEGVLDIIINDVFDQRLTMGTQNIDRFSDQINVSFVPGSRSMKKSLNLNSGDVITLESILRAVPSGPLTLSSSYDVFIDEFYLVKVN